MMEFLRLLHPTLARHRLTTGTGAKRHLQFGHYHPLDPRATLDIAAPDIQLSLNFQNIAIGLP